MDETTCGGCRHYIELPAPYHFERPEYLNMPEGMTVHGFCAKDTYARGIFYPVYIPESTACKAFEKPPRAARKKTVCAEQMEIGGGNDES